MPPLRRKLISSESTAPGTRREGIRWRGERERGGREEQGQWTDRLRSEIDTGFFVLTVDLWSADGKREVNLVRHSATSPSISAATSSSYPPPQSGPLPMQYPSAYRVPVPPPPMPMAVGYPPHPMMMPQSVGFHQGMGYMQPEYPQQTYPQATGHLPPPAPAQMSGPATGYYPTTTSAPVTPTHYYPQHSMASHQGPPQGPLPSPRDMPMPVIDPRASPSGMFTRNLIGSLCVSAFKLTCPENNMGVWFILQDLSVRTEGSFRWVFFGFPFLLLFSSPPELRSLEMGRRVIDR